MRIYLDACALNRPSDDQAQARVRTEAEAAERILRLVIDGHAEWSASIALLREIRRNPDREKRNDALSLLSYAGPLAEATDAVVQRAETLRHAEVARADVLLTTDDRFLRQAQRGIGNPLVRIMNPVEWLKEVQ